jgi:hypothetical protein
MKKVTVRIHIVHSTFAAVPPTLVYFAKGDAKHLAHETIIPLDGRFNVVQMSIAVPKSKAAALAAHEMNSSSRPPPGT